MTTKKTTELTENWTRTAKEMVSQSRKWAETARGMTLGPWQGMFASNDSLAAAVRPWFEMTHAAHDRWLDLWETQTHAAIDATCRLTETVQEPKH
jgi:hypothetical protein